jgi:hypothetical protein
MKTFLKTIAIFTLLGAAAPTFAGVRFGFDIRFGAPLPPREVICARPFADAIWYPGYYNYFGSRYNWVPGRWDHPRGFEGRHFERWEHRDRDDRGGRGDFRHDEGRIR